jgi:DNA repair exonuclease SbcCD ATPase subunit
MSTTPEPAESAAFAGTPEISEAAEVARERLHREIERVRHGVEEMLDEQEARGNRPEQAYGHAPAAADLRHELASLRIETRDYVKKKVRKSEKKLERSVREIDARTDALERRIDEVEADREEAEWRIHNNTEEMLDDLLDEIRSIADRLADQPAPAPRPGPGPVQPPSGRVGPRPLGMRTR